MEKRVLLAVFLSFLVLFVYQQLVVKPAQQRATKVASPVPVSAPEVGTAPAERSEGTATAAREPVVVEEEPATKTLVADGEARETVVENEDFRAVFSNRGGVLTSWRLKKYPGSDGGPAELVPRELPEGAYRPFSVSVEDRAISEKLAAVLFRVRTGGAEGASEPQSLVFEYQDEAGLRAEKRFVFEPEGVPYIVAFSALVENQGTPLDALIHWGPGLADAVNAEGSRFQQKPEAIFLSVGERSPRRLGGGKVDAEPRHEGNFRFVGVDDHYFVVAMVPAGQVRAEYRAVPFPVVGGKAGATVALISWDFTLPKPASEARFFLGPKDFDIMARVDGDFVRVINFGWFSFLVVPLLRALKWVNGYVGNYGWSIIILTLLINGVMFPLRHKSVVSMRKMQELQPEIKSIQERYGKLKATDPARQKMNTELMALYRERGVNPASGCLPMLLTMPVLFAFYSLLAQAIEIRGAPFILWIKDLSVYDPWFVTPLLMGGTMFWQQKMTPTSADPSQQKVMMVMPLVFTFMFLWAPSGLVIYWLVSNLWAIGQQQVTNRLVGPPAVHVVRPPAERRVRKSGKVSGVDAGKSS